MTKAQRYPAESRHSQDKQTGASIRQITSHPSIHHHPFFMIGAYDDALERVIFTSERTGKPQLFAELRATGELLQLTDRPDLSDWSIHPARNGRYVYFTAGSGGWRIDLETLAEEKLVDFGELAAADGQSPCVNRAWLRRRRVPLRSAPTTVTGQ